MVRFCTLMSEKMCEVFTFYRRKPNLVDRKRLNHPAPLTCGE